MDKDFLFARSSWQPPSTKENFTALESKRQLLNVGSYCIWQKKLTLRCTQLCLFVLLVFCAFWAPCVPGKFNDQCLLSQHAVFLPIPKRLWVLFLLFFSPFQFQILLSLILFYCFHEELFGYIPTVSFEVGRHKYDTHIWSSTFLSPSLVHLVIEAPGFKLKAVLTLVVMSLNWEITSKFLQ